MNEPEWRDANPETADLPGKGRAVIQCIAGGLALGVLCLVGMKVRVVGLAAGSFACISGLGIFLRKRKEQYKIAAILAAAGFLLLLTFSSAALVKAVAGTLLITGSIGLVVFGLFKAVKLSWDLGNRQ